MTLIAIFSHKLTPEQIGDAKINLKIKNFIFLPQHLFQIWSQIPTDIEDLDDYLEPIYQFLESFKYNNPYVLIQGDFGATYLLVNYAKSLLMTPVYSTTKRISCEKNVDGEIVKTSYFKHILFRRYS